MAEWVWPKPLARRRVEEFESIFGKLVVRYTRSRGYATIEGQTGSAPYRVVWSREGPVFPQLVLVFKNKDGESAQHIFFDSPDSYYIQGGKCAEYFKRVRSSKSKERTRDR
jgi:hypothetical protein